jgi:hypothetical protein
MPLLTDSDIHDLTLAWNNRRDAAFYQKVEDDFVEHLLSKVPLDLRERMLEAIASAKSPRDLYVKFEGGMSFKDNHIFTAEGWGARKMSLKQVIYRTKALKRIAEAIGPNIVIRHGKGFGYTYFTIDFMIPRMVPSADIYSDDYAYIYPPNEPPEDDDFADLD